MKYSDIKQFPRSNYQITVDWKSLQFQLDWMSKDYRADFDPDFQRGHVWTEEQQISYCEYILRGGPSGRDVYFNCPNRENGGIEGDFTLVDGKQRIQAVLRFLNNEIRVFGTYHRDFEGPLRSMSCNFQWHVAAIETRAELLEWYLDFNSGGTDHRQEELDRVRELLRLENEAAR
jgi:hypothetical protein